MLAAGSLESKGNRTAGRSDRGLELPPDGTGFLNADEFERVSCHIFYLFQWLTDLRIELFNKTINGMGLMF